jgi:hypothetical protein
MKLKRELLIGFISGITANLMGIILCLWIISMVKKMSFVETFNFYNQSDALWMILALGALPNLLIFFGFLKKDWEYRARGVLMATFITAITTYLLYFF